MLNLGVVNQDSTVRIPFSTSAAAGGASGFSATIEAADFDVYKDGGATQRSSTAGFTVSETFDTVTGLHALAIDLSDDTDSGFYAAGSTFWVALTPDETVDSQTVAAWIGQFSIESDAQRAARELQETLYPECTISTVTSNSTTAVNLTDILDAQTDDDSVIGWHLAIKDATDGAVIHAVITDFVNSTMLATVELYPNGGAMPITVAAGDKVWLVAPVYAHALGTQAKNDVKAEADTAISDYDPPTNAEMEARTLTPAGVAKLEASMGGVITGAAATGTLSTTQATTDLSGYTADQLIGRVIVWTSGDCQGEATDITDYAVSGGLLTFTALTTAPADSDTFFIV